jgi:anti-sigma factor RsiW
MSAASAPIRPEELSAYLDGELDLAARERVEAHLAAHPEAAARLAEYRRRDAAIRLAFAGLGASAVAATVAALALGVAAWRYAGAIGQDRALAALAQEAVTAHLLYGVKSPQAPLGAAEVQRVSARLSALLGARVGAPDLGAFALRLVGFHELAADPGPAALLVYRDAAGDEVSCYYKRLPAARESGFEARTTGEAKVVYRLDARIGYAVAGTLPLPLLRRVAAAGYPRDLDAGTD